MKLFIDGKTFDTEITPLMMQPVNQEESWQIQQGFAVNEMTGKPVMVRPDSFSDVEKEAFADEYFKSIK